MNIETKTYVKVLTPDDEANVLCNGVTYGRKITIPLSGDETEWTEMTEAAAEAIVDDEEISDEEFGAMVREVL